MIESERLKKLTAGDKQLSASQYNIIVDTVKQLARSGNVDGLQDSTGFHTRRQINASPFEMSIFEVQSAATGDGVYNCYEQTLDATEWADTAGDAKFDDKNETSIEVLNLREHDPAASYAAALALYDKISAWQMADDEGNNRWVGIPCEYGPRRVRATEAATGAAANITCNIMLNNGVEAGAAELGYNIEVYGDVCGGTNLNAAVPRIADDDYLMAQNIQGKWYFVTTFNASQDC